MTAVRQSTETIQQQQGRLVDAFVRAGGLFGLSTTSFSAHEIDGDDATSLSSSNCSLVISGAQAHVVGHDDLSAIVHPDEDDMPYTNDMHGVSECSQPDSKVRSLHLDELLQPPTWTLVDCGSVEALRQRLYAFRAPDVQYDLDGVKCTRSTQAALSDMPLWTFEVPLTFEFYTDGAFETQ